MGYVFNGVAYQGTLAKPYLAPAIAEGDTIERGLVTLASGLMGKEQRLKADVDPVYASMNGEYASAGTVTTDTFELDPVYIKVQQDFNQTQLLTSWNAIGLTPRSVAANFQNNDLAGMVAEIMTRRIKYDINALYWGGKKSLGTTKFAFTETYNGVCADLRTDATANRATSQGTAITLTAVTTAGVATGTVPATLRNGDVVTFTAATANTVTVGGSLIIGQSFKVANVTGTGFTLLNYYTNQAVVLSAALTAATVRFINASNFAENFINALTLLPANVGSRTESLRVVIPYHLWNSLQIGQAQATAYQANTFNLLGINNSPYSANALGYRIEMVPAAEPNTIVVYEPSNLWWGTADGSDMSSIAIIDRFPVSGEQKFRYTAQFGVIGKFAYPAEAAIVTSLLGA